MQKVTEKTEGLLGFVFVPHFLYQFIRCEERPHTHMLQLIPWHVFNLPSLFEYYSLLAVTITKPTGDRFFFIM